MMEHSRTADAKVIFAFSLVHFIGDFYISFVNPLLPVFVEEFSLTLTQVGLIVGISRLLAFVVQPSVGYLADRYQTRFFILTGPRYRAERIGNIRTSGSSPRAFCTTFLRPSSNSGGNFFPLIKIMVIAASGSTLFRPWVMSSTSGQ